MAAKSGSAIAYDRVSKRYTDSARASVEDVSLTVEPGELVVLLGPSGCGKTTLLKMTNRLIEPTSGTISIDGADIRSLHAHTLRRGIGYVIQQTGLFPHMRIADNIAVVPKMLGWDKKQIAIRVDELLTLVGLDPLDYRRRYPSQLSGGEQQRVGLARAMAADPSMMLMDEPFGALDAITRVRLQDELLRIHRQIGKTILFVTHDIEEAVRLADRIVIMREGKLVQFDAPLNIVLHPADSFVRELVGAEDVLRRLSLIPVTQVMDASTCGSSMSVPSTAHLRDALSILMETRLSAIDVVDESGKPIGQIGLNQVLNASTPQTGEPA